MRLFMAGLYVCLPNTSEIHVTITNSQFHLALLTFLLAFARPPARAVTKILDCFVLVLGGLSGPFSVVMLPLLGLFWYKRRYRWSVIVFAITAVCACIQAGELLQHGAQRPDVVLGASPSLLVNILARQIYGGALLGKTALGSSGHELVPVALALLGTAVLCLALLLAPIELRSFVVFCYVLLAISLARPLITGTIPIWQLLLNADGMRYWFLPMLAFVWCLVWLATQERFVTIKVAAALLLLPEIGSIFGSWRYPPFPDLHFETYARDFERASTGDAVAIPLVPAGWIMNLSKKGTSCPSVPKGSIDTPASQAIVRDQLRTEGWVTAAEPITALAFVIDNAPLRQEAPSVPRPDVDTLYPRSPVRVKGWGTTLDISGLPAGPHELQIRARLQDGCDAAFAVQTFLIAR